MYLSKSGMKTCRRVVMLLSFSGIDGSSQALCWMHAAALVPQESLPTQPLKDIAGRDDAAVGGYGSFEVCDVWLE
jgi:hypothetical protein